MRLIRFTSSLILMGLIVVWISAAAEADTATNPNRYDLNKCIQQVLRANPGIREAELDIEQADLELKSAALNRTPKIELINKTGVVEDARGDGVTGEDLEGDLGPFNKLDVLFTQPLYTFGRISQGIAAAENNVERSKASRFKTQSELIQDAHRRYFGYVLARQLVKISRNIQSNFSEAYAVAMERLEKGDAQVTETDALKLKVGRSVVTKSLHAGERRMKVAKEALREIMGLDSTRNFEITDQKMQQMKFVSLGLDHYLAHAMENNPDILQLRAALKAEEARYRAERTKYYPTVLALGGIRHAAAPGRDNQDNPFLNDDFNYFDAGVALGLKWDLNFLKTHNGIKQQYVKYLKVKNRLEKVTNGVKLMVSEKYHRYKEKESSLDASFEARKAGRALLFLNFANFKLGLGSGKDVFDSLSLHARTDGEYSQSIFDYNMAVVELLEAVGLLSPERLGS